MGPLGALFGVLLGHQFDEDGGAAPALADEELAAIGERFFRATFHSWVISPRPTAACRSWRSPPRARSWRNCA